MKQPVQRAKKKDSVDRARAWIRDNGRPLDRRTAERLGFSHGTELAANRAEKAYTDGLKAGRSDPLVDRSKLSKSAQERINGAERAMRRHLDADYAKRRAGLDEEVRQRVLKETKDYLAMLKGREAEAEKHKALYQEFMALQDKVFTRDQFMLLMMCVHGGEVSPEKRKEAGQLLNAKRFALTGDKS